MTSHQAETVASRYQRLQADREPYLIRARASAKLTIPTLIPDRGSNATTIYETPFQSLGARGLKSLAAKYLLSLLPPNSPFFRLRPSMRIRQEAKATGEVAVLTAVETKLSEREQFIQSEIEVSSDRVVLGEALLHVLCAGNVALYIPPYNKKGPGPAGQMRMYPLHRFVCRRDPMGNLLELIIHETVARDVLPAGVVPDEEGYSKGDKETVDLYTHFRRDEKQWLLSQEAGGVKLPGSEGKYPLDTPPFILMRYARVDGEHYSRSFVEELYGDLASLEGLMQAVVEGAAAAAKVIFLVNAAGQTSREDLAKAPNGAFITGLLADVAALQVGKFADFRTALETIRDLTERLSYAFLLNSAIQRNGERVTAEEIRRLAEDLDSAQAGLYSLLAVEFQPAYLRRKVAQLEKAGILEKLPKENIQASMVTGLEALGRGQDLQRLQLFLQSLPPPIAQSELNGSEYARRVGTALGIDLQGLLYTEQEKQAQMQQAQMQRMGEQVAPQAIQGLMSQLQNLPASEA